MKIPQAKG